MFEIEPDRVAERGVPVGRARRVSSMRAIAASTSGERAGVTSTTDGSDTGRGYRDRRGTTPGCEGAGGDGRRAAPGALSRRAVRAAITRTRTSCSRRRSCRRRCTDERVNMVTPALFAKYPDAGRSRGRRSGGGRVDHPVDGVLPLEDQEPHRAWRRRSSSDSAARSRSRSTISSRCRASAARPATWCARCGSTSRACRSTRTSRGSRRGLKLTTETDPVKIEHDLGAMVPPAEWGDFSLRLIEHGRRVCDAQAAALQRVHAGRDLPVGRQGRRRALTPDVASRTAALRRRASGRAASSPGRASGAPVAKARSVENSSLATAESGVWP